MPYPLTVKVSLSRWASSVRGELGNYAPGYAAPEDWMVVGIEPNTSSEDEVEGHARVQVDARMYAPIAMQPGPRDRITVRDLVYDVVGYPQDADLGPWWKPPYSTILLKRIEAL